MLVSFFKEGFDDVVRVMRHGKKVHHGRLCEVYFSRARMFHYIIMVVMFGNGMIR